MNFNSGVATTGNGTTASAADVVGILLVGGLTSVRPMTAAPSASVSLDSDYVCRMPKPFPFSTFGSFGDVNHEGRPVVCGGSRIQPRGGGVERCVGGWVGGSTQRLGSVGRVASVLLSLKSIYFFTEKLLVIYSMWGKFLSKMLGESRIRPPPA